jgi:hypothetical protein
MLVVGTMVKNPKIQIEIISKHHKYLMLRLSQSLYYLVQI